MQEILPVVAKITDTTTRNEYRKKLATALSLDERVIISEWKKLIARNDSIARQEAEKKSSAVKQAKISDKAEPRIREASENILRMVWHERDLLEYVLALLPQEIFPTTHQEIIDWLKVCMEQEKRADELTAAKELSEAANTELSRILMGGSDEPRSTEIELFKDSVNMLRQIVYKKKYSELLAQADKYNSSDRDAYIKAVQESLKIKKEIDKLQGN